MRFSPRSRSFPRARSRSLSETTSGSRCAVINLFSVQRPTPKSDHIRFLVRQLISAIRNASNRNSSSRFSPIIRLLWSNKCYQRSGIKTRNVQVVLHALSSIRPPQTLVLRAKLFHAHHHAGIPPALPRAPTVKACAAHLMLTAQIWQVKSFSAGFKIAMICVPLCFDFFIRPPLSSFEKTRPPNTPRLQGD